MNKLIKRLVLSLSLVGGMLLPTPKTTAQQLTNSNPQFVETSPLRTGRADDLVNLLSSQYVAKDINDQEYDIDAILKSGKAILIDFSTTWCKYCWELHNLGTLEKLYAKFGPEGTKQLEVFWVEAQGASKSKIQDPNKDWTKDSNGKPVPYPLFSDSKMASSLGIYLTAYPILVLVGPGNKWIECSDELLTSDVDFKKFESLLGLFITKEDKPQEVAFSGMTDLYLGESATLTLHYTSIAPITSIEYNAPEGLSVTKISDTQCKVTAQQVGDYEISVSVTNKNGTTRERIAVSVSEPISSYPFFAPMDHKDKLDKGWRSVDHDGDGFAFDSALGRGYYERVRLSPAEPSTGAEDSNDCLVSWGTFFPVIIDDHNCLQGCDITPQNELRSAPMLIEAHASRPTFSCYIKSFLWAEKADGLKVMIFEPGGTPVELLAPQTASEEWTQIQADLSAYKGKTIYLSLIPVVNGPSGIAVDQLRVTMDGSTTEVETPTHTLQTSLYPNPATDLITIRTVIGSTIELFASDGTIVATTQATSAETTISVAQLPAGRYLARITAPDGETIRRPIIIR
ncbi:T9SS type A sorting domain-containing protein [uncultured Porphyromonas sp.]|uniref:T9SS type A sorting domain-containing protein n=1 Tax=uncultured Porphyromonas sp. TaxID=159274 RepID=UPI0026033A78|nr:T9SS type A sorting domain-containing protein [uncultured Porphyromonas sp.]